MHKKTLDEKIKEARRTKFTLPPNIKSQKQLTPSGNWSYVFRHDELGELGRILVLPHTNGIQTQLTAEVSGSPDDPLTKKRRLILEPIAKKLMDSMAGICGDGEGKLESYVSPQEQHIIKSMIYPCEVCRAITAFLIFAPDTDTQGRLEDYARLMYAKIQELKVPTWVVGTETENIVNGEDLRKSLVLKVFPNHGRARVMTPDEVMGTVEKLMSMHCKRCKD